MSHKLFESLWPRSISKRVMFVMAVLYVSLFVMTYAYWSLYMLAELQGHEESKADLLALSVASPIERALGQGDTKNVGDLANQLMLLREPSHDSPLITGIHVEDSFGNVVVDIPPQGKTFVSEALLFRQSSDRSILGSLRIHYNQAHFIYLKNQSENAIVLVFLSLLVVMVLAGLFLDRLLSPLSVLVGNIRDLDTKRAYRLPEMSGVQSEEVQQVYVAMNELLADLQLYRERLEERVKVRTRELRERLIEQRRAEQSLGKVMQAMEQTGEAVLIIDAEGRGEYANPAFERLTGYKLAELKQQDNVLQTCGVMDSVISRRAMQRCRLGEVWKGELTCRNRSGKFYPAFISLAAILDTQKRPKNFVAIIQDQSMRSGLEEQLRQSQKMESIGVLAGGIAHDFNNMLAGIIGSLELAMIDRHDPEKVQQWLEDIETISHRAADLVAKLLAFARKNRVEMHTVSMNHFLKDIRRLMRVIVPESISLSVDVKDEELACLVDVNQLQQVVINLLNNAVDAVNDAAPEHPSLKVRLSRFDADKTFLQRHPDVENRAFACITISDNGTGISKEIEAKVFEPFFTTKEVGKGTGLGLSMAYGILQRHGGTIELDSAPGAGTTFRLYLPLDESGKVDVHGESHAILTEEGETILIADDDSTVLDVGQQLLKRLGYRVLAATSSDGAIALFEQHQSDIDLAILDLKMPNINGPKLADLMREKRPDLPVMFVTGGDLSDSQRDMPQDAEVLFKPLRLGEMSRTVRALLEQEKKQKS